MKKFCTYNCYGDMLPTKWRKILNRIAKRKEKKEWMKDVRNNNE